MNYEVINRKCFQNTKRKDEAPKLEIRSKNVHGEFIVEEEMFYDEKDDIFESTTYESEYITTENSSEASEVVENSTNEDMETTDENSDTEGLNDINEQGNENSDTENSG